MKVVIVGCGRVGALMATTLDAAGHEVIVIDLTTSAFNRLPSTFRGTAIRGSGTDEDTLRRAGAVGADAFLTLTEGDNRNVLAAQLAIEALGIERVVAKINDPVRAEVYAELGVATICRTSIMANYLLGFVGLAPAPMVGIRPASGHAHSNALGASADPSVRTTAGARPATEA